MKNAILLVCFSTFFLFLLSFSVNAVCPDVSGNWAVTTGYTCTNEQFTVTGNISLLFTGVDYGRINMTNSNMSLDFSIYELVVEDNGLSYIWLDNPSQIDNFSFPSTNVLNASNILLWSVTGDNLTTRNLSVNYTQSVGATRNTTDWRINNQSIMLFNTPFDVFSSTSPQSFTSYGDQNNLTQNYNNSLWSTDCAKGGCQMFNGNQYMNTTWGTGSWYGGNMTGGITACMWVRYNSSVTQYAVSLQRADGVQAFSFGMNGNNIQMVSIRAGGFASTTGFDATLQTNKWYHICAVTSATESSDGNQLYVNGTVIRGGSAGDGENAGDLRVENLRSVIVGFGRSQVVYGKFNGSVDEVKIFNRTLNAQQIKAMYEDELRGDSWRTIHSDTTSCGENWSVAVWPLTSTTTGTPGYSNELIIRCVESGNGRTRVKAVLIDRSM